MSVVCGIFTKKYADRVNAKYTEEICGNTVQWENLDPARPNPMQLTVELSVSSDAFLCTELSSTFSQPSTKLFRFVSDRALNALT